ncbi:MAG: TonB-dependent receptor plug domain-containing protein [Eudoraea sp.]|nr:TonB-dependent receptor plug domain-containing protein [Eudoraea sp.]
MPTKKGIVKLFLLIFMTSIVVTACTSSKVRTVSGKETSNNMRSVTANTGEVSILLMLQRVPGITVRGNVVRVFGPNSFSNTTEPLFLVDGVAYSGGLSGILGSINPEDVKVIEVYKTPAELGLYGARGSNGVINIILRN